jgi:hypothetical protein
VAQNVSWGVIISGRSLVLQKVGRYHSGSYACSAANDRGEVHSLPVMLKIHCEYRFGHLTFTLCYNSINEKKFYFAKKRITMSCDEKKLSLPLNEHVCFARIFQAIKKNTSAQVFNHNLTFPSTVAPVCISPTVTVVGASLEESVHIPCRVNANPPKMTFEWTFSNSGERFEVPPGHHITVQNTLNENSRKSQNQQFVTPDNGKH